MSFLGEFAALAAYLSLIAILASSALYAKEQAEEGTNAFSLNAQESRACLLASEFVYTSPRTLLLGGNYSACGESREGLLAVKHAFSPQ